MRLILLSALAASLVCGEENGRAVEEPSSQCSRGNRTRDICLGRRIARQEFRQCDRELCDLLFAILSKENDGVLATVYHKRCCVSQPLKEHPAIFQKAPYSDAEAETPVISLSRDFPID